MADDAELPYIVEYAKSSRSSCKHCKEGINKDVMRMGIMVQSPRFDGRVPMWYHFQCFFAKQILTSTGDIIHFDNLRYEDQKKVEAKIGVSSGEAATNGKKKKKSKAAAAVSKDPSLAEFQIEYAKSGKSSCKICTEKITKNEVRISKLDRESETARRFGPCPGWHHVDCFVQEREDLGFAESGDMLPGFDKLKDEDKEMIKEKLKADKQAVKRKAEPKKEEEAAVPPKKSKKEDALLDKALKAQSKLIFGFRDKLKDLKKKEMQTLLESNSQDIAVPGESGMLDALSDALAFGALKPCPECGSQLRFATNTYKCSGYLTGWTKCVYTTKKPDRKAFVIPKDFKEQYSFLNEYKYKPRDRLIPERSATSTHSSSAQNKPLKNFKIAIVGQLNLKANEVEDLITKAGGKIVNKIDPSATCVITTKDAAEKNKKQIKTAQRHSVFVISEEFLNDASVMKDNVMIPQLMKRHMIFSWGDDPLNSDKICEKILKSSKSSSVSSGISSLKVKLNVGGKAAVDPASGMDDTHHVLEIKGSVYNAVLSKVNIMKGTNSFYKLQLLKANSSNRYVIYRAWGRVGTTIGDSKTVHISSLEEAIEHFETVYFEQTGNHWCNRNNFVKQPGLYYPLDIDYGSDHAEKVQTLKPCESSKLAKPVQELICMIFDVEAMKKAMLEFEIDLKKMPLGKLSKKQIQSAYAILGEIQKILNSDKSETKILDASNRFYTLIPHDFGMQKPPILDNEVLLQIKTEMLESLLDIECAYNMLQQSHGDADPIDEHYNQLKTDVEVLDRNSKEFERIQTYVNNTHASTHAQYKLHIEQVFKINRHGESERYQKFKDLHNKQLLWHGSRKTNYAGILSQGLRIAPPEAPVTGYMFGKGVYFADMVSKSANYCFTSQKNPTGLLMLCEVALGDMYERVNAEFVQALPKGTHSTKGLGQTHPDPKESIIENGVEIPLGKPVPANSKEYRSLLYNEYIVYDVNQINIKYLLQVKFNWK